MDTLPVIEPGFGLRDGQETKVLKRSSNKRLLALAAAGVLGAGLLTGCGGGSSHQASSSSPSARGNAGASASGTAPDLVMESSPETTITQDFNPFQPTSAPYGMGATGLIYEPLIQFDLAKPPTNYKWLATGYKWSNGGKTITFTIRKGVKWNDGQAFTPADVAFTFDLVKHNPAINSAGLKITSVTTSGDRVTLTFPQAQYTNLENIAGQAIVPKHIWSKVGNPANFTDPRPVGTGPYVLGNFTAEGFTLTKNPHYWQKSEPKVQSVYFPVYTSNTGALDALFSGKIDWTGNYIPGLQKSFVNTAPKYHHYWEAAGGDESLEPNLTKWPTNQLAVRQAISVAVSRKLLASEGEAGLENPVLNATGLTMPTFSAWSGPVKNMTLPAMGNAAKARSILQKAGYQLKGKYFYKGGKEVSLTIISPSAYTDMSEVDSIAAQELRNAGIDATFQGISVNAWNSDVASGSFQMTEHWSNGGITPYNMYNGWLNSALAAGNSATGDYERLNNPQIDSELATLAGASTVPAQTKALAPIAKFVAQDLPVILSLPPLSGSSTTPSTTSAGPLSKIPMTAGNLRARTMVLAQVRMKSWCCTCRRAGKAISGIAWT